MSLALMLVCAAIGVSAISRGGGEEETIRRYLQKYGYLNNVAETSLRNDTAKTLREAIALFQEYYQLPGNGELNEETISLMRRPRCGLEDELSSERANVPNDARRWPGTNLRWNFHLGSEGDTRLAQMAFAMWSEYSALSFKRDSLIPNILISFAGKRHIYANRQNGNTCTEDFDGEGGTLAHAYFPTGDPSFVSEVHIDNAEQWHVHPAIPTPPDKINLLQTLVHEIGHSLGLSHSPNRNSIMYAYAPHGPSPIVLSNEDVFRIRKLYGVKTPLAPPPPSTTPPPPPSPPTTAITTTTTRKSVVVTRDVCALTRVDNVLVLDQRLYVAYGRHAWPINKREKTTYRAPILLTDYFRFLPVNFTRLSAVYQTALDDLVLFVNDAVYLVSHPEHNVMSKWPRRLAELGLPGNAKINAAFQTNRGQMYVIYNGRIVGELNPCTMTVMRQEPLEAIFPGIPRGVTSVFRYTDGGLYFIVNKRLLYKFDEYTKLVTAVGKFDLQSIGITCPRDGLLKELRDLLNRIVQLDSSLETGEMEEEEEET